MQTISRTMALAEMEVKEAGGRPVFFSVSFYTKAGEVRFIQRAQLCGWKNDMGANRIRNIQEYDIHGFPVGHAVAVSIDLLRTFNEQKVIL